MRFETGAIHVEHKHWTPKTKIALKEHIYCLPLPWHVVSSHDPPENKPAPPKNKLGPGAPSRSTGFVLHWRRDRKPSPETQYKEISRLGQALRFQSTNLFYHCELLARLHRSGHCNTASFLLVFIAAAIATASGWWPPSDKHVTKRLRCERSDISVAPVRASNSSAAQSGGLTRSRGWQGVTGRATRSRGGHHRSTLDMIQIGYG